MTDRIFVLDEGRVVEEGSHRELMSGDTLYRRLYLIQQEAAVDGRGGARTVSADTLGNGQFNTEADDREAIDDPVPDDRPADEPSIAPL
jgi:ABC-type glutathione transport system ATPase component